MTRPETKKLLGRARSLADQVFIPRHRKRYDALVQQERRRDPLANKDVIYSRAKSRLRQENRYEWAQTRRRASEIVYREAGWVDGRLGRQPALQVPCERCGAKVGHGCRTVSGYKVAPHVGRRALADRVVQPQPAGEVVLADPRDVAAS